MYYQLNVTDEPGIRLVKQRCNFITVINLTKNNICSRVSVRLLYSFHSVIPLIHTHMYRGIKITPLWVYWSLMCLYSFSKRKTRRGSGIQKARRKWATFWWSDPSPTSSQLTSRRRTISKTFCFRLATSSIPCQDEDVAAFNMLTATKFKLIQN